MIKNLFEAVSLLKAAPKNLKNFQELLDYARNIYKDATGTFPDGIDFLTLKNAAREVANIRDPKKVVQFPGGGKDKISPFKERPGEGELSVTIEGETKNMTPEGIMNVLMGKGKGTKPTKKEGQLFNISGQKGDFLTEDEFARELESNIMNFKRNSPGFNLQLIPNLKKPGAKAYNPFPKEQGDKFLTDDQRQRVLSSLEDIMKNEEYQIRFANNFADLMEEGDKTIEFAPDMFKIDPPKKADGGRIGFKNAGFAGDPMEGDRFAMAQPQEPGPMGPVFETGDIGAAAKEVMTRMAGPSSLLNIPMGRGFGLDFGLGTRRSIDAGISFNPQNPNFNLQLGVGALQGKPVIGAQFSKPLSGGRFGFKDGSKPKSPGRRNFIKFMAGLASLPVVGKLFKPAAKVAEAGPVIAEGVKLGFDKFMMLVDKIKRLGRSADNLATQERQKVIRYEGKDGSDYELVEDLTTGDISVTKDRPGIAVYGRGTDDVEGIDVIEDRSTFVLRRGQADETTKGKTPPDEYDEAKLDAYDGETFDAVDDVDDKVVNEILEELGETRIKKSSGGLAYMLGE